MGLCQEMIAGRIGGKGGKSSAGNPCDETANIQKHLSFKCVLASLQGLNICRFRPWCWFRFPHVRDFLIACCQDLLCNHFERTLIGCLISESLDASHRASPPTSKVAVLPPSEVDVTLPEVEPHVFEELLSPSLSEVPEDMRQMVERRQSPVFRSSLTADKRRAQCDLAEL